MSTPAIPKQVTLSPLYKLLCLEAAALEADDILPQSLTDELALTIERLHKKYRTAPPEGFGEYTAAQHKAVNTLEAVVKLKDSTAVFGMK
jgi:hypothetical protein